MNHLYSLFEELFVSFNSVNYFINISLKAFFILSAVLFLYWILKRSSASLRSGILNIAFCSLIIIPALSLIIPQIDVEILPAAGRKMQSEKYLSIEPVIIKSSDAENSQEDILKGQSYLPEDNGLFVNLRPDDGYQDLSNETIDSGTSLISLIYDIPGYFHWLALFWFSGAFLLLTRLAIQNLYIRSLCLRSKITNNTEWNEELESYRNSLKIRIPIHVVSSSTFKVPAAYGILKPMILLPESFFRLSGSKRKTILLHELAHIKRFDYLFNLIVQAVCAIYWFNPLTWYAARKQRIEREKACDDFVIETGFESSEYAKQLVEIAGMLPRKSRLIQYAVTMADKSELKNRIIHILQKKIPRKKISLRSFIIFSFILVSFSLLLAGAKITDGSEIPISVQPIDDILMSLKNSNPAEKKTAAWSLGEREDHRAVPALIEALNDNDPEVIGMAAWALGEIKDRRSMKPLMEVLSSDDPYVREMVVKAIGEHEDPGTVNELKKILKEDITDVRLAALWALGEIKSYPAFNTIITVFNDEDLQMKETAIESAVHCNPRLAVTPLIELLSDKNGEIRSKAIYFLGEIRANRSVAALIAALKDSSSYIRTGAVQALGKIGDPRAVEPLISLLRDKDPGVRAMTIWALDEIDISGI
ncbi:MAG: hypothetical protein GY863_21505 [bacterium]|nr:hypothetical protein [bacterium]